MKKLYLLCAVLSIILIFNSCCQPKSNTNSESTAEAETTTEPDDLLLFHRLYATNYFSTLGSFKFNENDAVSVDKLIMYFELFEMTDEAGYIKKIYQPYQTDVRYQICIPREMLCDYLLSKFNVNLIEVGSEHLTKDSESYILDASAREGLVVDILDVTTEEKYKRITISCKLRDSLTNTVIYDGEVFHLCIEVNNNGDVKYVSCT